MQHTDKAIAEFEAWWIRQPHREQFEDVKDQMRNVWVASRRELVIELPEGEWMGQVDPEYGLDTDAVRASIEAAGVTVRG